MQRRGWPYPPEGVLHLAAIRGAVPWAEEPGYLVLKENIVNSFNDTLAVFGTAFGLWLGTIDPGLPYTMDPLNSKGCAHLQDGVWLYQLGLHKGNEALTQAAPVTVWRDFDKDSAQDQGEAVESGFFGINGHCMSGDFVEDWSAGCWGPRSEWCWGGPEWLSFLGAVKASGQSLWNLYVLEATDLIP